MSSHRVKGNLKAALNGHPWLDVDRDAGRYLGMLLEHSPVLASAVNCNGDVLFASVQYTLLAGVADKQEELSTEQNLYPPALWDKVKHFNCGSSETSNDQFHEISILHKDGVLHHYQIRRFLLGNGDGDINPSTFNDYKGIIYTIGIDVTDTKIAERALQDKKTHAYNLSFHDPLTGLANRSLLYDRLRKSLSRAKRSSSRIALVLLDINDFKIVNQRLGRDAGDICLKQLARRMQQELRDTDTIARLGSDEFVVVLENIDNTDSVENIAQKLLGCFSKIELLDDAELSLSASIGISLFPANGETVDALLKSADAAMSQAKACSQKGYRFYQNAMASQSISFLLLENDLQRALEQDELRIYYQPQFNLRSGKIVGLEALVRWQHRHRGLVSPIHFIPLAEETGLIEPLGAWVLEQACQKFQSWLEMGIDFGKIAVNLSTRQFRHHAFEKNVANVLERTQLPPHCLELEITESSAMENAANTVDVLNRLSQMGLSLSIDDFGTGYSSLAYLHRFPIQKLKIDRSFVEPLHLQSSEAAIAKSIIDMAHNMKLEVLAEGVERTAQASWLLANGCEQVQGYYYSRALSEEQLLTLVGDTQKISQSEEGECFLV